MKTPVYGDTRNLFVKPLVMDAPMDCPEGQQSSAFSIDSMSLKQFKEYAQLLNASRSHKVFPFNSIPIGFRIPLGLATVSMV